MTGSRKTRLTEWIATTNNNLHSLTFDASSSESSVDYHSADGSYSSTNLSARIHHCHSTVGVCFVADNFQSCIVDDLRSRNSANKKSNKFSAFPWEQDGMMFDVTLLN